MVGNSNTRDHHTAWKKVLAVSRLGMNAVNGGINDLPVSACTLLQNHLEMVGNSNRDFTEPMGRGINSLRTDKISTR